ncbi:UDP-4-amino-4,6-dideoxy-N-acetyl-beta-L-altrosamine transaminase [Eggerthella guodeyinii]|uniref:UDP-4-amino-4, 6-dideoxy-N-acetyl-beta-L-altrosamine transaminase n=1 Tax=Eggerthella guodeyinii TaxID=2690837 RepID=A0A6N7RRX9_9ACTN|nr:UDP-4-amino-4,6-dideoxy-N-acetyl-beta-L-altrosamine transaminase [Eggerthella guodeyinii]MRX84069.1 UDP-4-amino-4,6-dideoxy-N-acetyl-beta-L-altrosamine transaminase [Eggerthella guodeyinii]
MELAIHGGVPVRGSVLSYGRQSITETDISSVVEVLKSDFLTCGPAAESFESALAEVAGARYATAVSNGTAALHVACLAAGVGPGDEVIVSSITFAASANCVLYCGGTPVFADIDPNTWNISAASIRSRITEHTKAIIAVDFGGCPVDLDALREICDEFDLLLIEDAAHSLGSLYRGKPVGGIADITTFSFHPVKTITTGEGGAVTTNDEGLARRITLFAKHGITRDRTLLENPDEGGWYYEQLELGYNYRMSDIQAALGMSQLRRLGEFANRRREIVTLYNQEFSHMPEVSYQRDATPESTVRHLYCLRFDTELLGVSRRFVFDALRAEGIGVNVHYLPVYRLPYYRHLGYKADCCPEANAYYENAITLPLHYCMADQDAESVVAAVRKIVDWCKEQG